MSLSDCMVESRYLAALDRQKIPIFITADIDEVFNDFPDVPKSGETYRHAIVRNPSSLRSPNRAVPSVLCLL